MSNALENGVSAARVAYEPELIPSAELMRCEGIDVLEEWFRWSEEWSMLLRVWGRTTRESAVLEIGCGLGRIAFPLRYVLSALGTYDGFDICEYKVDFLKKQFTSRYPNFRFKWANIHNAYYNPGGTIAGEDYRFEYNDSSFDVVFAASVFTHTLPEVTTQFFKEIGRVLRPGGRAVLSFFLLDNYVPGRPRPLGFAHSLFNVDHPYAEYGDFFRVSNKNNPEEIAAYRLRFLCKLAEQSGLLLHGEPLPGLWSASSPTWVGAQDVLVLTCPD